MVELFLQWCQSPQDTKELQQKHDNDISAEFLRGFHEFSTHTGGLFGSERPCWQNTGIKCADWYFLYSLQGGVFGHFACRVAAKILGSGDAERCFKYLKDATSQKRTRLTPNQSKKQATLIHQSQMNADAKKAALKIKQYETTGDWTPEFKDLEGEAFFSLGCNKLGRKLEAELMQERAVVVHKAFTED